MMNVMWTIRASPIKCAWREAVPAVAYPFHVPVPMAIPVVPTVPVPTLPWATRAPFWSWWVVRLVVVPIPVVIRPFTNASASQAFIVQFPIWDAWRYSSSIAGLRATPRCPVLTLHMKLHVAVHTLHMKLHIAVHSFRVSPLPLVIQETNSIPVLAFFTLFR
jgi:hypothetical protein